jgi:hypothetical protein
LTFILILAMFRISKAGLRDDRLQEVARTLLFFYCPKWEILIRWHRRCPARKRRTKQSDLLLLGIYEVDYPERPVLKGIGMAERKKEPTGKFFGNIPFTEKPWYESLAQKLSLPESEPIQNKIIWLIIIAPFVIMFSPVIMIYGLYCHFIRDRQDHF